MLNFILRELKQKSNELSGIGFCSCSDSVANQNRTSNIKISDKIGHFPFFKWKHAKNTFYYSKHYTYKYIFYLAFTQRCQN